jgi:hypothetical protein
LENDPIARDEYEAAVNLYNDNKPEIKRVSNWTLDERTGRDIWSSRLHYKG